jgi:hypothetical protein
MNFQWTGLVLAVTTFAAIGTGHILVRHFHPIFGTRPGIPFIVLGGVVMALSIIVESNLFSGVLGIVAITTFWDGLEFFRQEKRVQKGQA